MSLNPLLLWKVLSSNVAVLVALRSIIALSIPLSLGSVGFRLHSGQGLNIVYQHGSRDEL